MADVTTQAIADFLLARIAEDEESAGRIASTPCEGVESDAELDYFRFTEPTRIFAECEAKRQIVEQCAAVDRESALNPPQALILADDILRTLVQPYANHPAFNDEWRTP